MVDVREAETLEGPAVVPVMRGEEVGEAEVSGSMGRMEEVFAPTVARGLKAASTLARRPPQAR